MNNKRAKYDNIEEFEKNLFYALKENGYLFPENENDIQNFEELYGDTEIEFPQQLQLENILESDNPSIKTFDSEYSIAAFMNEEENFFDFKNDEELTDKDQVKNDDEKS